MSKEVVINRWCDNTEAHPDGRVAAVTTIGVAFRPLPMRELDLCELCEKSLTQPLESLLGEAGQPVASEGPPAVSHRRPPSLNTPAPCPVPGCGMVSSKRSNLVAHVRRAHHTSLHELEGTTPKRAAEPKRRCPVPGCEYVGRTGGGLSSHLRAHSAAEQTAAQKVLGKGWGGTRGT